MNYLFILSFSFPRAGRRGINNDFFPFFTKIILCYFLLKKFIFFSLIIIQFLIELQKEQYVFRFFKTWIRIFFLTIFLLFPSKMSYNIFYQFYQLKWKFEIFRCIMGRYHIRFSWYFLGLMRGYVETSMDVDTFVFQTF